MSEEKSLFKPLELNEEIIERLYDECLATSESVNILDVTPFLIVVGFDSSKARIVYFDVEKLNKNKKLIWFLIEQMRCIHEYKGEVELGDILCDYRNNRKRQIIRT